MDEKTKSDNGGTPRNKTVGKPRGYAVIRFLGKRKPSDIDMIKIGVHGDGINYDATVKRNEYIPVPAAVVHSMRNAQEPESESGEADPNNALHIRRRKTVRFVQRFPFELVCWITKKQYNELRAIAKNRSIEDEEIFAVQDAA